MFQFVLLMLHVFHVWVNKILKKSFGWLMMWRRQGRKRHSNGNDSKRMCCDVLQRFLTDWCIVDVFMDNHSESVYFYTCYLHHTWITLPFFTRITLSLFIWITLSLPFLPGFPCHSLPFSKATRAIYSFNSSQMDL